MYRRPVTRENTKVYRLNWKMCSTYVIMSVFFLIITPFGLLGYSLNSKGFFIEDMFVYGGTLALLTGWMWLLLQVLFVFRLEIDPTGGRLHGFGKVISFEWRDAYQLDYAHWPKDNKFHLYLYLSYSDAKKSFTFPHLGFFPVRFSEYVIPVDMLQKYEPFVRISIERALPTVGEQNIHVRYFMRTELGQDIIRYAPHVFGGVLNKYLPDNDLLQ